MFRFYKTYGLLYCSVVNNCILNIIYCKLLVQIKNMKSRGTQFVRVPDSYYENLKEKLSKAKITVKEDLETVCLKSITVSICLSSTHLYLPFLD